MEDSRISSKYVSKPASGKTKPKRKIFLIVVIGLILFALLGIGAYFIILKDRNNQEDSSEEASEQTSYESEETIVPTDLEYDNFEEAEQRFTFQYPSNILRVNFEDINQSIPEESKNKFGTEAIFIGVLEDEGSEIQISSYFYRFNAEKSLEDIFDELMEFSQEQGLSLSILDKQITTSGMEFKINYEIEGVFYKSYEKILFEPEKEGIKNAFSISLLINDSIYDKYSEVAKYIVKSARLGGLSSEDESNSNVVNDIYLGKFQKGSEAPTDGQGVTETTSFSKEDDMMCLVSDLSQTASGFAIEVFDEGGNLALSEYNITLDESISSGCNEISFETGQYLLKISRNNEIIEQIEFEVN